MGHKFALDPAYLRMTDDELRRIYARTADKLLFGQTDVSLQHQVSQQAHDIRQLKTQILQMQIREIEEDLHIARGPTGEQEPAACRTWQARVFVDLAKPRTAVWAEDITPIGRAPPAICSAESVLAG